MSVGTRETARLHIERILMIMSLLNKWSSNLNYLTFSAEHSNKTDIIHDHMQELLVVKQRNSQVNFSNVCSSSSSIKTFIIVFYPLIIYLINSLMFFLSMIIMFFRHWSKIWSFLSSFYFLCLALANSRKPFKSFDNCCRTQSRWIRKLDWRISRTTQTKVVNC